MKKHSPRKYFKDQALLIKVGEKIREARLNKNMSLEMLANECEVDYSQVQRMEMGKVNFSISYLYKIAATLGVDPKDLLP